MKNLEMHLKNQLDIFSATHGDETYSLEHFPVIQYFLSQIDNLEVTEEADNQLHIQNEPLQEAEVMIWLDMDDSEEIDYMIKEHTSTDGVDEDGDVISYLNEDSFKESLDENISWIVRKEISKLKIAKA